MFIKVLGSGCPNCLELESHVRSALAEMNLTAEVVKVTAMEEIMSYAVMSLPALVVDEVVVLTGRVPAVSEIKEFLKNDGEAGGACGCC